MRKMVKMILSLLFLWFTIDITGFDIGQFVLVESPGLLSLDTLWWILFLISMIVFSWKEKIGKYIIVVFLFAWMFIQYLSHWQYTFFGAKQQVIDGYNRFFSKTHHIVSMSNDVIIPDTYHIVLFLLIIIAFLVTMLLICSKQNKKV